MRTQLEQIPAQASGSGAVGTTPAAGTGRHHRVELPAQRGHADGGREAVFRLPAEDDPAPDAGRMLAMCTWATSMGLLGVAVGIWGMMGVMAGTAPAWYEPTVVLAGVTGVALTVGAFTSIHRRLLPWALLALATLPFIASMVLTAAAF